jgi:hypothetical protein
MTINGEATNAAIKEMSGEILKSKNLFAPVDEHLAKIIMYIWWLLFANYTRTGFKVSLSFIIPIRPMYTGTRDPSRLKERHVALFGPNLRRIPW